MHRLVRKASQRDNCLIRAKWNIFLDQMWQKYICVSFPTPADRLVFPIKPEDNTFLIVICNLSLFLSVFRLLSLWCFPFSVISHSKLISCVAADMEIQQVNSRLAPKIRPVLDLAGVRADLSNAKWLLKRLQLSKRSRLIDESSERSLNPLCVKARSAITQICLWLLRDRNSLSLLSCLVLFSPSTSCRSTLHLQTFFPSLSSFVSRCENQRLH